MRTTISLVIGLVLLINLNCSKKEDSIKLKGLVNFTSGTVNIIDADGNGRKANIGDEITQGMKVETKGPKSFVDIYIGDYIIKILGDTTLDIEQLFEQVKSGNKQVKLMLEKGKVFSRITSKLVKGDIYEVSTPTATAGVRGTDFLVTEEEGKSNVACLKGLVEVLNNSLKGSEPVMLEPKEETDVIPGEDMVKKQISSDKLRMLNILTNIRELRKEIRQKFEKQREEIRQHVKDQRAKNREILDAQKEKDKALVEDQKKRDRENIDSIKGDTDAAARDASGKAKEQMENVKVDKDSAKEKADEMKESVKPVIDKDKFKVDKDQFKK